MHPNQYVIPPDWKDKETVPMYLQIYLGNGKTIIFPLGKEKEASAEARRLSLVSPDTYVAVDLFWSNGRGRTRLTGLTVYHNGELYERFDK